MRNTAVCLLLTAGSVLLGGCETPLAPIWAERPLCTGFSPSTVHIAGLTQLTGGGDSKEPQALRVFVELRDLYDSKLKAPVTLRFELYRYVQHSSNPRGTHLQIWPDFVLIDPHSNHLYWREYLRAYEFSLDVSPPVPPTEPLLLEATCHTGEQKRISALYILNPK